MALKSEFHLFEEVAKHNQTEDCWVIIRGKVYDVSHFMEDHPGGPEVLLAATGKDGTSDFVETGHSTYAEGLMDKYCIGEIDMATVPSKPIHSYSKSSESDTDNTTKNNKKNELFIKIMQFLAPLLILGLALLVRNYTNEK